MCVRQLALALLLTAPFACQSQGSPVPRDEPAPAQVKPAPDRVELTDPPKPESAPALDSGQAQETRKAYLVALEKGRRLSKAQEYPEAIEIFEDALELDPDDVPLMGELGWAALMAEDYARCDRVTRRALLFAREDKVRGMLLYNLGRSAEAQGDLDQARAHYTRSLRLRSNDTVRARLAGLDETAPTEPAGTGGALESPLPDVSADPSPSGLRFAARSLASVESACTFLVEHRCDEVTTFTGADCRCAATASASQGGLDAQVLSLETGDTAGAGNQALFALVRTSTGQEANAWDLSEAIGWEYNPGAFGIFESLRVVGLQMRSDIFADRSAAVIEIRKERADSNLQRNELESESAHYFVVCAAPGGKLGCTRGLLEDFTFSVAALIDSSNDPDAPSVTPRRSVFSTTLHFPGDGNVHTKSDPPAERGALPAPMLMLEAGEHALVRLMKDEARADERAGR